MKLEKTKVIGIISITSKGYGFVKPTENIFDGKDIFIPKAKTLSAADQDEVEVNILSWNKKDKGPEGEILKIINRKNQNVIGTVLKKEKNFYYTYINSRGIFRHGNIKSSTLLKKGDKILIKVTNWTDETEPLLGECKKNFGNISDPSIDIPVAIEEYNIRSVFDENTENQAKNLSNTINADELENRVDLTKLPCITIDPSTAQDFDDAVSCIKDDKNVYHLGVHIADVSHYVKEDSFIDEEAYKRCNSTYFPGQCVPMIPFKLSNNLCSLKEKELRLTISVMMDFDSKGNLSNYKIFKSCIKSKKRFTYEEAFEVIQKKKNSPFYSDLNTMVELALILKKIRINRGAFDFSFPEAKVIVDKNSKPISVQMVEYDISHQLIEEFMLKANEIVAMHLDKLGVTQIFRVHEKPSNESLSQFYNLASAFGIKIPEKLKEGQINKIFEKNKNSIFFHQLATSFIKSSNMAYYVTQKLGHFGLALEYYCHFTSPIRRYADLTTHRLLFQKSPTTNLDKVAQNCSEKEKNSFKAEMSVVFIKKLRLLNEEFKKNPQKKYPAIISKIKPYSFTFELTEYFLEGSLHISEIHNDYYEYNKKKMNLKGRRSNKTFSYGDKINIIINDIDLFYLKIDWKIAPTSKKGPKKKKR